MNDSLEEHIDLMLDHAWERHGHEFGFGEASQKTHFKQLIKETLNDPDTVCSYRTRDHKLLVASKKNSVYGWMGWNGPRDASFCKNHTPHAKLRKELSKEYRKTSGQGQTLDERLGRV